MSSLLALILLSLQSNRKNENLTRIASQFFNQCDSVTILKGMKSSWNIELPLPVSIFDTDSSVGITHESSALLLYTTGSISETLVNRVLWNSDTKVLVVSENGCTDQLVSFLWQKQACQTLVVNIENELVQICTNENMHCPYEHPKTYPKVYNDKLQLNHFIIAPNLKNCTLNVSFVDLRPYVQLNDERGFFGNEGDIVSMALQNLGATMNFINRGKTNWGKFDPPSGLIGDVAGGVSFLGVGGMFPFLERHLKGTMVQFCLPVNIGFFVPKGLGPNPYSTLLFLTSEFSTDVWIIFIVTYSILIPLIFCIDLSICFLQEGKHLTTDWPLLIFQMILGVPVRQLNSKTTMISCLIYGFLVVTFYKSLLSSKLSAPIKVSEITTRKELKDSGLPIKGAVNTGFILEEMGEFDPVIKEILGRHERNGNDSIVLLKELVEGRNFGIFRYSLQMLQFKSTNPELTDQTHEVEEKGSEFFSFALLRSGSCFRRTLVRKFSQICEGGFLSKSLKDVSEGKSERSDHRRPRILGLQDFEGLFILTVFGGLIALCIFLIELTVFQLY